MKKASIIFTTIFIILTMTTTLFIGVSLAWFTDQEEVTYTGEMGFVEVEIEVYFDDGVNPPIPAMEVELLGDESKPGSYYINITSNTADYFIEDLRVDIIIKSNIDTYFRVKIYEQLTFIYTNSSNETVEMTIPYETEVELNYDFTNWYDNRIFDNYLYYKDKVKRVNETTDLIIPLIDSYFLDQNFDTRSPGYSLQMAFSVEAVQALNGPQNNWGFENPPWGGNW